jgi:hypothetical protein
VLYGVKPRIAGSIGWMPPPPFRWAARVSGLSTISHGTRQGLTISAWVVLGAAFLLACQQAWENRLSVRAILVCAVGLLTLATLALPIRPAQDIYLYSIYGRIVSRYHLNPYVVPPRTVSGDALFPLIDPQWWNLTSPYGPAFIRLTALLTWALHRTSDLVLAFKALAWAATLGTILLTQRLAARIRPQRTAFAVALIGLNPAVVMIGVGAGHNDALAGLAVALGLWLMITRWGQADRRWMTELAGTGVLTLGALVKFPVAIVLLCSVVICVLRSPAQRRIAWAAAHAFVVGAVVVVVSAPLFQTHDPTFGASTLSRFGGLLAPTSFLHSVVRSIASGIGGSAGADALSTLVLALLPLVFLFVFAALLIEASRAMTIGRSSLESDPAWLLIVCGWAVLLFLLASPAVWPWYFVWILPLAWVLPSLPRVAIAVMSAVLPVVLVLAGTTLSHELIRDLQLFAVAPGILLLLTFLLVEVRRRLRTGTLLPVESHPSRRPHPVDVPASPVR